MNRIQQAARLLARPDGLLVDFMPHAQRAVLMTSLSGEEGESIAEIVLRVADTINTMPKTYETDWQGENAIVHLHYFGGSIDAWLTEKDAGDGTTDVRQHQAFGMQCLTGDKQDAELGYVSIEELIRNNIELDLYWTPKPLKEI